MIIDYTVKIVVSEDNIVKDIYTVLSHKTEFNPDTKETIKTILEELKSDLKEKYPTSNGYSVTQITPTFKYISDTKDDSNKELLEESKKLWTELYNSKEFKIIELENYYSQIIEAIKKIRESAKEFNLLNTQKFLNFMDELNKLSIDPEQ